MRLATRFEQFADVLKQVRKLHPVRRGEKYHVGKSLLDEVRSLIEQTGLTALGKLSFQFDTIRLLACVEIAASDKDSDIAQKAAIVASLRPRDVVLVAGWFKLVALYPHPIIESLLKKLIESLGFNALLNHPGVSHRLPQWFIAATLPAGILRDYRNNAGNTTLEHFFSDHELAAYATMRSAVWLELLTKGHRQDLRRQPPDHILTEMRGRQKTSERIAIGQNYLNRLDGLKDWDASILTYILKKWGKPGNPKAENGAAHRFWNAVDTTAQNEFNRWLMLGEIESFFDGDRADFWRDYVNRKSVQDVNNILGGEGFMLDFGHFGVIEFKNVGNAAYIYPEEVFKRFWTSATFWANSPSHFKEISQTIRSPKWPGWDGRILHFAGWQSSARDRIRALMVKR